MRNDNSNGILWIVAFIIILWIVLSAWRIETGNRKIRACEEKLPRNHYCELIAVPEKRGGVLDG